MGRDPSRCQGLARPVVTRKRIARARARDRDRARATARRGAMTSDRDRRRRVSATSALDVPALIPWMKRACGDEDEGRAARRARTVARACARGARSGAMTLRECALEDVHGVPRRAVEALLRGEGGVALYTTRVAHESSSADGSTTKLIVELQDGHRVEACVMRHAKGRTTLCVSSQVGCKMGCTFCATGTLGELGNLSSGEILEQLAHAGRVANVRNVVFMGMGEPLNNYDAVMGAIAVMTDDKVFGLSPARVTVSTVGVIPRMRTLTRDAPGTCLALSLHAPTQELRQKIVPTAVAYKLDELMRVLDEYLASGPKMKTMIEYCVLGGVNDDEECAEKLGELFRGKEGKIILNLIPLNPTDTPAGHVPPTPEAVRRMMEILTKKYGLFVTKRHTMGDDIAGACGQLALKTPGEPDIEDMMAPRRAASPALTTKAAVKATQAKPREPSATTPSIPSNARFEGAEYALLFVSALSVGVLAYAWFSRRP